MQGRRGRPAITLPNGVDPTVTSVWAGERLVVGQVQLSPTVNSRTRLITVRVKVKDTRGYVVRDARSSAPRRS